MYLRDYKSNFLSNQKKLFAWRTSLALVRERIKDARTTKAMLTKDISEISAKLSNTTQPEDFRNILHWVNCHKNKVNKKSKKHLIKKYEYLLNQDTSKTKHFQLNLKKLVVKLSNHNLTEPQNNVLALGLNFATNPKRVPYTDIVAATEQVT